MSDHVCAGDYVSWKKKTASPHVFHGLRHSFAYSLGQNSMQKTTTTTDSPRRTITVGTPKGRMYDAQGRCNTLDERPLMVSVQTIAPGRLWNIHVGCTTPGGSHVDVLVDAAIVEDKKHDGRLFATGLLYDDECQHVLDEYGQPFYDSENNPMRRAPIVVQGPFEGARFNRADWQPHIRIDCVDLLSFWLEIPVTLA
jgi:hypothetical protein